MELNGYERVMSCVMGKEVDRTPVSGVLSLYGAKLANIPTSDYYRKPELFVDGQKLVVKSFDPDILFTPFALALETEIFGCEVLIPDRSFPYIKRRPYFSIQEIKEIDFDRLDLWVYEDYLIPAAQALSQLYKGEKAIGGIWADPYDLLLMVVGPEMFVELCLFHTEDFQEIIEKFTQHSLWVAKKYLASGVDFLVIPGAVFNKALLTREIIEAHLLQPLKQVLERVGGPVVLHNGGYKLGTNLELYKDLPHLMGVVINKADSLEDAFAVLKDKLVIGNFSSLLIQELEPDRISLICRKMFDRARGNNNYILMTSEADIPYDATEDQVRALMQSPDQYAAMSK